MKEAGWWYQGILSPFARITGPCLNTHAANPAFSSQIIHVSSHCSCPPVPGPLCSSLTWQIFYSFLLFLNTVSLIVWHRHGPLFHCKCHLIKEAFPDTSSITFFLYTLFSQNIITYYLFHYMLLWLSLHEIMDLVCFVYCSHPNLDNNTWKTYIYWWYKLMGRKCRLWLPKIRNN